MTLPFEFDAPTRILHADDLDVRQAILVVAMRLWTHCVRLGRCPCSHVERQLGSRAVTRDFLVLMTFMAAAWPDPLCVHSPCCRRLSWDEALLLDMIALAGRGERRAFDTLLREMIDADSRERLFAAASRVAEPLAS